MRTLFFTFVIFILIHTPSFSQIYDLSGEVVNSESGDKIEAANIIVVNAGIYTTTNKNGIFNLKFFNSGEYEILFSHTGFSPLTKTINIPLKETVFKIELEPAVIDLGEVVITGLKYTTIVKESPLPVVVTFKENIEKFSKVSLADVVTSEPGVTLTRDGIWATDISIRGLTGGNIVFLIDGNRVETATEIAARMSMVDLNDVQRIEIIKGGTSSLYGSGATGGIVNVVTSGGDFSDRFFISGNASASFSTVNGGFYRSAGIKTGDKNWYLTLRGTQRNATDVSTPEGKLINSYFNDNNISASAGVNFFEKHNINLSYQKFYAEDVGLPGNSSFPSTATVRYPEEKREMFSIGYTLKQAFNFLPTFKVKYFYQEILRDVEVKVNPMVTLYPRANHYTNGVQAQFDFITSNSIRIITGLDIWQRSLESRRRRVVSNTNTTIGERPLPEATFRSSGIFIQSEFDKLLSNLNVSIGGRYDFINVENKKVENPEYTIVNGVRNDNPNNRVTLWNANNFTGKSWSLNLSTLYKITNSLHATFNYGRSFRAPSIEERFLFADLGSFIRAGNPFLEPEDGNFFDLGFRVWEDNFSLRLNGFLNMFTNLVSEEAGTFLNRPARISVNVGKATLTGFDLFAEYRFFEKSSIYLSLAYVSGKDTENDTPLRFIPPLNATSGVKSVIYKDLEADFNITVFNAQDNVATGEFTTPGYAIFSLGLNYPKIPLGFTKISLSAGVENIFDKAYKNHLATNRGLIKLEPGRNFYFKVLLAIE